MKRLIVLFMLLLVAGCDSSPDNSKASASHEKGKDQLVYDLVKSGLPRAENITLTEQVGGGSYLVELNLAVDPITSGANDWNNVAIQSHGTAKKLFAEKAISRLHVTFYSPENKGLQWASVWVDTRKLPSGWEDSHLLFFSAVKPDPGTVETANWLCDFYRKYETARPGHAIPSSCS